MSYREVIEDSLKKIWKKKEIDDFFQLLEKTFPFEKKVSLGYYINEIIEKEPFINKYKILEYTNRMEKYKNSYEFLEN
ncbi:MAG: hypothetical protein MJH09_08010 [Cetobacterium sp.]|nr:hypothetical protein [Cetobacterium sp.]